MRPTVEVDLAAWKRAAAELAKTSSRSVVDFTNGQALRVASLALKETAAADARRIEQQLGATGRSVSFKTMTRGKNKGKTRTVRGSYTLAGEDTLAHRIVIARRVKTGKFGIKGNTLAEKAANLIRARIASAHFIRSGWIPAIKKLASVVYQKPPGSFTSRAGARQRGQPKGTARPAVFSLHSFIKSEIENSALNAKPVAPSVTGNPMKPATEGLQKALQAATRDMIDHLAKRLKKDLARHGAK